MQQIIKSNGDDFLFQFQELKDLYVEGFLLSKVMCRLEGKTHNLVPIQFEKERLEYIIEANRLGITLFNKSTMLFYKGKNYTVISPSMRYDLKLKPIKNTQSSLGNPKKKVISNGISLNSNKQLPQNIDKKRKAGKRIETNELGKRLNLLASKCFKFNESLKQWENGKRKVDHTFVIDTCISFSHFSEYLDDLFKKSEKSHPNKGNPYTPRPRRNSVNEDQKSSDAMDYRLPGSFGTGKRR